MIERKYVGDCFVDAGLIWIGDPCYVIGRDSSHGQLEWSEFCERLWEHEAKAEGKRPATQPLGNGTGICTSTTWGDGSYPVHITYRDGMPIKMEINLEGPYEEWDLDEAGF